MENPYCHSQNKHNSSHLTAHVCSPLRLTKFYTLALLIQFSDHQHKYTRKRAATPQRANLNLIQTTHHMRTDSLISNYRQQVDKNIKTRHSPFLMLSINRISHFTSGMQEGIAYLNNLVNPFNSISSSGTTEVSQYSLTNIRYSSNTKLHHSLLKFRIDYYASKAGKSRGSMSRAAR